MRQQIECHRNRQRGMVTISITMAILLLAALVTLYTVNTSVKEQTVTTDHYRAEQAFGAAQAGVDVALDRHNEFPIDDLGNPVTPVALTGAFSKGRYTAMFCDIWDDDGAGPKNSELLMKDFLSDTLACTNPLTAEAEADGFANDPRVGILSVGKPDDDSGRRTISIVSAPARIFNSDGKPAQPLISKSTVDITGTLNVINRYQNATIWSAEAAEEYSSSVSTYINDGSVEPCTGTGCTNRLALVNPDEDVDTLTATEDKLGQNSDIVDDDNNLASLEDPDFFLGFFADDIETTKGKFEVYDELADLNTDLAVGKTGLLWLDDSNLTGQINSDMGDCSVDPPVPVVFVVEVADGDTLRFGGGNDICGIVFIFGDVENVGTVIVSGAMIATGAVGGAGTFTIVYDPEAMAEPPEGFAGSRGPDAGTWKDWGY